MEGMRLLLVKREG